MPSPAVNASGQLALIASLIDPAVPSSPINLAIFGEAAAPIRLLVAHEGDPQPAPGTVNWANLPPPTLSGGGAAFNSNNGSGVWTAAPGNGPVPVARTGDPAPGTTGMFSFLDQPVGNAAGTL